MAARDHGPRLSMRAHPGRPGEFLRATLIVDSDRAIVGEGLDVVLRGHERIHKDGQRAEHALPAIPAVLSSDDGLPALTFVRMVLELTPRTIVPGKLPAGRTSYECHFQLPVDLPPTYRGRHFEVGYAIHAHLDVSWGGDLEGAWHIAIGPAPPPGPAPGPPLRALLPAPDGEPLFSLEVDSSVFTVGAPITGRVELAPALGNIAGTVALVLLARETTVHTRAVVVQEHGLPWRGVALSPGTANFGFTTPDLAPGFLGQSGALQWWLEAHLLSASPRALAALSGPGPTPTLRVPIHIEAPRVRPAHAALPSPVLSDEAVAATWQRVAQGFGLSSADTRMAGVVNGCALTLQRTPGVHGSLVAELRFQPLRIGLRVSPDGPSDEDVSPQVQALLTALRGDLPARTRRWLADDHIRLVLADSGRHEGRLLAFVGELIALAGALELARAELPLPAIAGLHLPTWYALGHALETPVERGDLSIRPLLRDLQVVIVPLASAAPDEGLPAGLRASITTSFPLDLRRKPPHASIQVDHHEVVMQLRQIEEDAATLARHVQDLANLAHDLRLTTSPYR
ncbi:MAG: hypothetical protein IT370_03720 [Deltaproteobacteria bacterium]|nr:hypothetical protein [Deltaproteobacteria bacterium]